MLVGTGVPTEWAPVGVLVKRWLFLWPSPAVEKRCPTRKYMVGALKGESGIGYTCRRAMWTKRAVECSGVSQSRVIPMFFWACACGCLSYAYATVLELGALARTIHMHCTSSRLSVNMSV